MNSGCKKNESSRISDGWVRKVQLSLPSLQDNTADADRLIHHLRKQFETNHVEIDLELLRTLPSQLRQWHYAANCVVIRKLDGDHWYVLDISDPNADKLYLGVAIDLGTSRIMIRLLDLTTSELYHETAFDNPQLSVGPDILTRIHTCEQPDGLEKLHHMIISTLNHEIQAVCRSCGFDSRDVYLIALAGNTSMTHLFMGLPPRWMIREPYIPVINSPPVKKASVYGLGIHPLGRVLIFPNIGSYFGGDLVSGILYSGITSRSDPAILVDVGTNAEVVLGNENWLVACAGAAGPALEGGVAQIGMMAGPGVIDRLSIDPVTREFSIQTMGGLRPIGICGSAMIDLAANLFLAGMIDFRGRLIPETCGKRLVTKAGLAHLEIVSAKASGSGESLTISQTDIDSLIRSKAAMFTILETVTESVGMTPEELQRFYVAGSFGVYIDPVSAVTIGMLPDLPTDRFQPLGNSSLEGASHVLTSCQSLLAIQDIKDKITYLELNVNQVFMNRFSAAKFLPHTDRSRFPRLKRS